MRNRVSPARLFAVLSVICVLGAAAGCCRPADREGKSKVVVAKINNYELTADDFRAEARLAAPKAALPADVDKAKEDSLNELIIKKILLQDAQRLSFDKDRKFMREIERYWEQALLKLLINRKIDEFSKSIPPAITGEARQKMLQSELNKWVAQMRNSEKVKIYKENLKAIGMGGPHGSL